MRRKLKKKVQARITRWLYDTCLLNRREQEKLGRLQFFHNAFKALSFNGIDGDYAEFGCCGGNTFAHAYRESRYHGHAAKLWAFDSFQGLPPATDDKDLHPEWVEGTMAISIDKFHEKCAANKIPHTDYTAVPGFYEQTLRDPDLDGRLKNIALAYIDCDLYSSTRTVLEFLMPRLKHGMIIAFDDYFCWSATQVSGERRAMLEFFHRNAEWELLPYMPYSWGGQSFVVESRQISGISA